MSALFAPPPWPAPNVAPSGYLARFGHEVRSVALGTEAFGTQWVLRRNCSISPRSLLAVYGIVCMTLALIGAGFWWYGALGVVPFVGLEALALGLALLVYARHATDREVITLSERELHVEHHCGRQRESAQFRAEWVSVEPTHGDASLIEVSGQGRRIRIGRYLRPEFRLAFARELRAALRLTRTRLQASQHD